MKRILLLFILITASLIVIGCSNSKESEYVGTSFQVEATKALNEMMSVYKEYSKVPVEERHERLFYDDFLYDLTVAMLDFGQKYKPSNYDLSQKEMKILSDMLELKEAMLEEDEPKVQELYTQINIDLGHK